MMRPWLFDEIVRVDKGRAVDGDCLCEATLFPPGFDPPGKWEDVIAKTTSTQQDDAIKLMESRIAGEASPDGVWSALALACAREGAKHWSSTGAPFCCAAWPTGAI